jgi:ABC-2 type transport system ATP-binding protein
MIEAQELTKRFGDNLAVDRLSLRVETGEVFGFLGPNGAGKTTTIRMLTALIHPTSGRSNVAGYEVGRQDDEIRRNAGILTEAPGLYERLSAERNLEFFAELYEVQDVKGKVEQYLRMLGLWERRHEPAGTFSKGMRQKLVIARAILHEPKVLFLDEPTSGLDPEAAKLVRDFIGGLKHEGRTIFMCTHNLAEADQLCDRIGVFNTRLLALDSPSALRQQLYGRSVVFHLAQDGSQFTAVIEKIPFVREVSSVDNKVVVNIEKPEEQNPILVRALVEAGADIQFVGEIRHSLEDVYLQLVKNDEEGNKTLHN